jgi:hypothetical protein
MSVYCYYYLLQCSGLSLLLLLDEKESGLDDSIKVARRRRRKRVIGNESECGERLRERKTK